MPSFIHYSCYSYYHIWYYFKANNLICLAYGKYIRLDMSRDISALHNGPLF